MATSKINEVKTNLRSITSLPHGHLEWVYKDWTMMKRKEKNQADEWRCADNRFVVGSPFGGSAECLD